MGKRDVSSSGANTEPLPFRRRFGDAEEGGDMVEELEQSVDSVDVPLRLPTAMEYGISPLLSQTQSGFRADESRRSPSRRSRSRSSNRNGKSKKRKRSRSHERERKHKKRSRSPRNRSEREHRFDSAPKLPAPLVDVAARLPPQIRSSVVAQSLLVKPEALPQVINQAVESSTVDETKERKRKSRWSTTKQFVPGMVTILPSNLDDDQRNGYLLQLEIEETTRKLRLAEFSTPGVERSPSPEPVYDSNGKRLNTRDVRKRQELEQLRHEKIQALLKMNPAYKPPADYRPPNVRLNDKVYIPQDGHPEINFVGLLIGPRGNTLKALEAETQAKIIIRGKGSVKEGKLGRREGPMPGENEPLHAFVTGPDRETIKKACARIQEIIDAALLIPDGHNELRQLQLRELAVLNGTFRPSDIMNSVRCSNCGSDQHKTWECPDAPNVTASIVCTACGNAGHIARDCKNPREGYENEGGLAMDDEYSALMAELGEKPKQQPIQGMAQFLQQNQPTEEQGTSNGRGKWRGGGRGGYNNRRNNYDDNAYGYEEPNPLDAQVAYLNQYADYTGSYDVNTMQSNYYAASNYGYDLSNFPPPVPPPDFPANEQGAATEFGSFELAPPPPPPS